MTQKHTLLLAIICLIQTHFSFAQAVELARFDSDTYGRPSQAVEFNSKLFFTAYTSQNGRELWFSDGTTQGTQMLLDINIGAGSSMDNLFHTKATILNGELYFQANNGIVGLELWKTDGTAAGTVLVKDANTGSGNSGFSDAVTLGANIYYVGGSSSNQLWRSDGTSNGTQSIQSFQIIRNLAAFNNRIYFSASVNNTGEELWRYNPFNNSAALFKDLNGVNGASLPCNFIEVAGVLYFTASTQSGWEWWKSNGTAAGTQLAVDINPTGNGVLTSYQDIEVATFGNEFFFQATDGTMGFQLWKSDGTPAGTQQISNFSQSVDASMGLPIMDGKIHYSNFQQDFFWSYDPSTGVNQQSNYPSYYGYIFDGTSLAVGDNWIYTSPDSVYGVELRMSDGASVGMKMIQETDLSNNWTSSTQSRFNSIIGNSGNKVLFSNLRTHSDTKYPLYSADLALIANCNPPSIIERVCINNTVAHIIWNRPEGASTYEIRFRQKNTSNWQTKAEEASFSKYNGLLPNTDYEIQIRSSCSGGWSNWSDIFEFTSSDLSSFNSIYIIGERALNANTMQIYWQRSSLIVNAQFRHREVGTSNWSSVGNSNGYRTLNNLNAGTFYEYQFRANRGSGFEPWPSFIYNYFYTPNELAVTTLSAYNIGADSAFAGGTVLSDGGSAILGRGMVWNAQPSPDFSHAFSQDGSGLGSFNSVLNPLQSNSTYYYKAYAYNANDTVFGSEFSFNTMSGCTFMSITQITKISNPKTYQVQFNTAVGDAYVLQTKLKSDTAWNTLASWRNTSLSQRNFQALQYNDSIELRLGARNGSAWTYGCTSSFKSDCKPMTASLVELVAPFCEGDSALLKAIFIGGFRAKSFLWNTGETSRFIYGQQGQNYSVLITDESACSDSASVVVSTVSDGSTPINFVLTKPSAVLFSGSWTSPIFGSGVSLIGYRMAYRQVNAGAAWNFTPLNTNTMAAVDFTGSGLPSANYEFAVFARVNDNGSIRNSNFTCKERKFYNGIGAKTAISMHSSNLLKLYPNPSSGIFYLEGNWDSTLELIDASGKSWILNVLDGNRIDIGHLANGVYQLKSRDSVIRIVLLH